MKNLHVSRARLAFGASGAALVVAALGSVSAQASEFQVGEVAVTTQVTVSAGFGIRTQDRDERLICPQNYRGSRIGATTCNGDDGNLNFDKGDFVYAPVRAQGEITAEWRNFTVYARGQALYDAVYDNGDFAEQGGIGNYRDLSGRQSSAAGNVSSHDYELMDFWVRGSFDVGDNQLIVRLGQQTINWGEAAVTPLSLAQVNSFDQAKLRVPGAEIRDALRSMPAALVTYEIGGGLSAEAFYQFDFRPSRTDAAGSFFSTTDIGGRGGVGFGGSQDYDVTLPNAGGVSTPQGVAYDGSSDGENWGVAARYFSPELNNTEFGLYFANITARSPVPSFIVGSGDKYITQTELFTDPAIQARLVNGAVQNFIAANPGATPAQIAAAAAAASTPNSLVSLATADNAKNSQIVLSNPPDVKMLGFSFNTTIDALGLSVAGEAAYMHDLPALVDGEGYATAFVCSAIPLVSPSCGALGRGNQLSTLRGWSTAGEGRRIDGYTIEDANTFVLRGIKNLGASDFPTSVIGASSIGILAEFGAVYLNLPDESILVYDAPGNGTAGLATDPTDPLNSKYEGATDWSGGVTTVLSASYPDAFGGVNVTPSVRFQTGLFGNTPLTGGYVERASALTLQVDLEYLLQWKGSVGYTDYFGAGRQNLLNDRDFFQMTLSYSF